MQQIEYAYAKVNLHLEVLSKRADGYHNILSIMALTGLFDLLKLDYLKIHNRDDLNFDLKCEKGIHSKIIAEIPFKDNLIYKAVKLFFKKANKNADLKLTLEKNIPAGAGLGGSSADAAAVLRLLNNNTALLSQNELYAIACSLGADVPFCLNEQAAICEGIGNIITPVNMQLKHSLLIANNGVHVDTGLAYKNIGKSNLKKEIINKKKDLFQKYLKQGDLENLKSSLKNDFEKNVFKMYPTVENLKKKVNRLGADFTTMTGSGSTIIGLFQNKDTAYQAQKGLLNIVPEVHIASFL